MEPKYLYSVMIDYKNGKTHKELYTFDEFLAKLRRNGGHVSRVNYSIISNPLYFNY